MGKNRKVRMCVLAAIFFVFMLFNGCGAGADDYSAKNSTYVGTASAVEETSEIISEEMAETDSGFSARSNAGTENLTGRKLIKKVDLEVETLNYDGLMEELEKKVSESSGYIESSELSGKSIYHMQNTRYANFVIRIPEERLEEFVSSFSKISNVISKRESVEDITLQYVDTESRKKSLQIEQERLFSLLEKADSIETIIALETRLSEVRYEIENYESTLRTYDNQVDYSTVTVQINEVERITEPVPETTWQRIKSGFSESVFHLTKQLKELFIFLVISIPYIVVIAIFSFMVFLLIRFLDQLSKKRAEKRKKADDLKKADDQTKE